MMEKAGLDISIFTPHSVRADSTSAAKRARVPISTILTTAGWTKDNMFRKYYDKPICKTTANYGTMLLESQKKK